MSLASLFKRNPTVEYPVLLCGLNNTDTSLLWQHWRNTYGVGNETVLGNPPVALLRVDVPGAESVKIKLYHVGSTRVEAPPSSMQGHIQFTSGQGSLLFVHNIYKNNVEDSVLCLQHHIALLYGNGGRGVWVMLYSTLDVPTWEMQDQIDRTQALASRFEFELSKCSHYFNWRVVNDGNTVFPVPSSLISEELRTVARDLLDSPPCDPRAWDQDPHSTNTWIHRIAFPNLEERTAERDWSLKCEQPQEWWQRFLTGAIPSWTHNDYLRALFLTLVQDENKSAGVLEVATDFANKMNAFKQRPVQFPQRPESRTITVFWTYHVKLALDLIQSSRLQPGKRFTCPRPTTWSHFEAMLDHTPQLLIQDLPKSYFSSDVLLSKHAEEYWTLPNLHGLTELPRYDEPSSFGRQITLQHQGDPERLFRFAFAVVQRYLRGDSPRRRSWFIDQGFASLQQNTIRLRTLEPSLEIPAFSTTHAYFCIQMVHLSLVQLPVPPTGSKDTPLHQTITYPAFKALFQLTPTMWTKYYRHKTWYSVAARAAFVPPDLVPLPLGFDTLPASFSIPPNAPFHQAGLIPETPSLEILNFHVSILLSDAQSLPNPLLPSAVTSHAALLYYIHTHLLLPGLSNLASTTIATHIDLLATHSPFTRPQVSFWLAQCLRAARSTHLPNATAYPYSITFKRSYTDKTGAWRRFHNCPCHIDLEMETLHPNGIGPNPVEYPHSYPYEHPPQTTHQCRCHFGEELDHEAFAKICAEGYAYRDEMDKQQGGRAARPATLSQDPWENFVRFNPVLAWEGFWMVYYSEEGWRKGVMDRRKLESKDEEFWGLAMGGEGKGNESMGKHGSDGERAAKEEGQEVDEADIADQVFRLRVAETTKDGSKTEGKENKAGDDQQGEEEEEDEEWEIVA